MTSVTRKGVTVEEAVIMAIKTLGVSRDEVKVEIVEPGRKGFLGIGARDAEVKVTIIEKAESKAEPKHQEVPMVKQAVAEERFANDGEKVAEVIVQEGNDAIEEAKRYLSDIAQSMKIEDLTVTHEVDGKYIKFQLNSKKAALLIGKRGQTLNAIQQLTQLVVNKYAERFKVVRIDIGDYRERRQKSLELLADRMADKAVRTGRKVQLEPMLSYERKIIHHALSNRMDIETYSEGADPHRYLVIESIK